jgi:hypothetical protein
MRYLFSRCSLFGGQKMTRNTVMFVLAVHILFWRARPFMLVIGKDECLKTDQEIKNQKGIMSRQNGLLSVVRLCFFAPYSFLIKYDQK